MRYIFCLAIMIAFTGNSYGDTSFSRLGGGVEDLVIRSAQSQSSFVKSQHSFTRGKKIGAFRNYVVTSDEETIVSIDVKNRQLESKVVDPAGDEVSIDSLITNDSDDHIKLLLDKEGDWNISLQSSSLKDNFMSIDQEKGPVLVSELVEPAVLKGDEIQLRVSLKSQNDLLRTNFENVRIVAWVTKPSGNRKRLLARDDGTGTDKNAGDSIVDVTFAANKRGQYDFEVFWSGNKKRNGKKLRRTSLVTFFVAENDIAVKSRSILATRAEVIGTTVEPNRFGLPVKIKSKNTLESGVDTYAEIWGTRNNQLSPIGWIGGKVNVVNNIVPFSFHTGWLQQEKFSEPFVMRNIKIFSAANDNANIVKSHGDIKINGLVPEQIAPDTDSSIEIDYTQQSDEIDGFVVSDEMLFGVDPSELQPVVAKAAKATAPGIGAAAWRIRNRVLFLHGFCDSGNGAFSNYRVTNEFPANERLIYNGTTQGGDTETYTNQLVNWLNQQRNAGTFDRIRGVVAHSQGGMVAANLLQNHRWLFSPTNNVYNPRYQIVSIGTPYNGVSGLEEGSRIRGYIREYALEEVLCNDPPAEFYPAQKWKNRISSYTRSRIHSIYTDGGSRDKWWHAPSSTWCANRSNNGSLSSWLKGNDDGLLRNLDTKGFASKDSYIAKKCHTPLLTKSGWEWQTRTTKLATEADKEFNTFKSYCQSTNDPDGDGWGWENGRSCVIPTTAIVYCNSSQSDPDGDGWGWENGRSCLVR